MAMTLRRRDPFQSFWTMPAMWDDNWLDVAQNQGLSMYETDEEVVIEANVAGVPEDKVEISIEGGTVTITARHEETKEEKEKKKVVYRQASEANYVYSVSLPTAVDQSKAMAVIENGVLKLTLPKREEVKPKRIEIKASKK